MNKKPLSFIQARLLVFHFIFHEFVVDLSQFHIDLSQLVLQVLIREVIVQHQAQKALVEFL